MLGLTILTDFITFFRHLYSSDAEKLSSFNQPKMDVPGFKILLNMVKEDLADRKYK